MSRNCQNLFFLNLAYCELTSYIATRIWFSEKNIARKKMLTQKPQQQNEASNHSEISVQNIMIWLKKYGMFSGIAAIIALIILMSIVGYIRNRTRAKADAGRMLLQQANMSEIINRYPNTPSAAIATLALASEQYHTGNFDAAEKTYADFITANPDHLMRPAAELGKINCIAAKGFFSEALAKYDDFINTNPDEFLLPQAVVAKGECLQQMNRLRDAKAVYEDFIAAYPDNSWAGTARAALILVEQQLRLKNDA